MKLLTRIFFGLFIICFMKLDLQPSYSMEEVVKKKKLSIKGYYNQNIKGTEDKYKEDFDDLMPILKKEVKSLYDEYLKQFNQPKVQTTSISPSIQHEHEEKKEHKHVEHEEIHEKEKKEEEHEEGLPPLGTKAGCLDALKDNRYIAKNLQYMFEKIESTHMYDGQKGHPVKGKGQFYSNIVGKSGGLFDFISKKCEVDSVVGGESEQRDTKSTSSACYFTCDEKIGVYWDGASHLPTERIKYIYSTSSKEQDKYHPISLYPAPPTK